MRTQILTKRYAQGLVNSIKDEKEYETLSHQLIGFRDLLVEHLELNAALTSPFLPLTKKMEMAQDVLKAGGLYGKMRRFILLLVENNRLELLSEIVDLVPLLWAENQGISTIEVASVSLLSEDQKTKLEEKLEILEGRPVSLVYTIDPELIGGLSLRKGNIVYDVSIKGSLENLKERISEG
jgi:F-type H+-transporting ATPase subunit delta